MNVYNHMSYGEQSEPTVPPLTRGATKSMGGYSKVDLNKRHLIFNGRHLPYNPDNTERARLLRKNMTFEEKKLWDGFLRKHQLRFLRQKPIDHFIVDFYCPEFKLAIEIDGLQHYSKTGYTCDKKRSDILAIYGVIVIRFSNYEINKKFENVCQEIQKFIDMLNREQSKGLRVGK